ncbi:MAG: hypothetical protein PHG00_12045 [Methylococcales bacterium]|nr:hypothetical protein [Methylococcales bacterium]
MRFSGKILYTANNFIRHDILVVGMITKQKYVEYLISTPINYTCFNLAEHLDNVSRDMVSNFLKRNRITARQVWEMVKGLIRNIAEAFLIIDDSVQDKRYSKSIELVKKQYSGAEGGLVRGISVVNMVHSDGREHGIVNQV